MAKWCFSLGIVSQTFRSDVIGADIPQRLKKIEVVEDEESDIIDAVRRMSSNYDFVVTRYETSLLISMYFSTFFTYFYLSILDFK